jgi:hypothetical protein
MTPKKRRVLFKLLAIRFMKGDRGEFSMDVALKQARQDEVERTERTKREAELLALIHRRKQEIAVAHQSMKVNHFSNFAANAQFLLFGGTLGLMGSSMSVLDPAAVAAAGGAGADGASKAGDLEQGAAAGEDGKILHEVVCCHCSCTCQLCPVVSNRNHFTCFNTQDDRRCTSTSTRWASWRRRTRRASPLRTWRRRAR